ncbi:MAG TPA: hypothetical protein VLH15_06185, partial [Dehalococcoidales bacterium]|nr:hypothetical protein [Dehalococcoidales bacterium]
MQFEHMFSPIKIGTKTARNRIIFPCHGVAVPLAEYIGYQVARARGGSGLNIIGPCTIHRSGGLGGPNPYYLETPEVMSSRWKQIARAVHEYGTLILVQFLHAGEKSTDHTKVSWGVSENSTDYDIDRATVPHEMTDAEINEVIDGYAVYAKAAQEAGMDGCEIHGAHGYLPAQFWSPWTNYRRDKWAAPMLFITQVIDRIREAVGKNFIISIRMSGDDFYPGPK